MPRRPGKTGESPTVLPDENADGSALRSAKAAYENALRVTTRELDPIAYAELQHNLGNTFLIMGERRRDDQDLRLAVAAYQDALQGRSRERDPLAWAETQMNLGKTLYLLGQLSDAAAKLAMAEQVFRSLPPLTGEPETQGLEDLATQEIEQIIARLGSGIAEERKAMDALLSRIRATLIVA